LNEAAAWYDKRRPGLGDEFLECVFDCVKRVRTSPESFARFDGEYRRASAARFPYLVFYEYDGRCVTILAVLHSARSPRLWRSRRPH
jgi:hypothetical protein